MEESGQARRDRLVTVALCGLILLAFALRVARLGAQDLWGDESYSAWLAQQPLGEILRSLAQGEPHPPLYPALLWAWVKAAGNGEFALRLVSALFGVLMVPLVATIGLRAQGRRLALAAALLATVNPFLIWYSQETRMYIAVAAFAAWAAAALLRGFSAGRLAWLEFAVAAGLMIYSHYYGLLVLAAFGLVIGGGIVRRRLPPRPWLGALGLIGLLYLPWVAYAARIFASYYGVAPGRVDLWGIFGGFWVHSALGLTVDQNDGWRRLPVFALLFLLGLAAAAWARRGRSGSRLSIRPAWLLGSWLFVPLVGGFLISIVRPMYAERYLIVSTVPLLILVAWGIVALGRWWPAQAAALVLVLVTVFSPLRSQYFDQRYVKSEYSRHTGEVQGLAQPGDGIILDGASQVFLLDYYYKGPLPHYPVPADLPLDEAATARELRELSERHSGLWVFLYATHDYDPGDFVEKWLSENAFRAWHTWTVNGRLVYYASYRREDLAEQASGARFGELLELRRFATRTEPYAAGEVIPLAVTWRALAPPERDLKISLRLRDAEGFLWGQTDVEPVSGFRPTRLWTKGEEVEDRMGVLILPGTPPGRYKLEMRVYPAGGAPLPVAGSDAAAAESVLTLGEVVVARAGQRATGVGIPAYRPIGAVFGGEIALEGESGMGEITAGQSAYLTVLWRALARPRDEYEARLRLVDGEGRTGAEAIARPANGQYGPGEWSAGDVVRWQYNLRVGAKTPPGEYRLLLSLWPKGGTSPAGVSGGSDVVAGGVEVELQRMVVKPRPSQVASAKPEVELNAVLDGKIALRGYSLGPGPIVPGGKLPLTLYWEPLAESDAAYTVFTHLLDGNGRIWAQQDSQPCGGGCPTTGWAPGDLIEDRYELAIKPDAATGEYEIEVGMYDATTGKRLAVADREGRPLGDRVLLPKVQVGPER